MFFWLHSSVSYTPESFSIIHRGFVQTHLLVQRIAVTAFKGEECALFSLQRKQTINNVRNRWRMRTKKSKSNLLLIATRIFVRFNSWRFHTVLCCDLCSVPHSQCDCIPEYLHHQYGPKQEKQHIMQRRHVYSVAGTTGSVWVTLQMKQGTGGEEGRRGLVAMGACILRANPWWFDWGPWQWTALTFDPVQPASLCHSQTHLREPRADCPKIVPSLIRRIFFFF